jgi:hypothetical protein
MERKSALTEIDAQKATGTRAARTIERTWPFPAALALVVVVPVVIRAGVAAAEPGPRPADALLSLVAPDVAVVVTVEGLRDQVRAFHSSRLAADLRQLPSVRAWLASEKFQQFEQSRARIEAVLGADLVELRDELVGDAVLLALRLPADGPADANQARGILLLRARNQTLLERLIRVVNTTQQDSGELAHVADRNRSGVTYHIREFPAASGRAPEWYVTYPDGTFAFSNSEPLIQAVIDRKAPAPRAHDTPASGSGAAAQSAAGALTGAALVDLPALHAVDRRLPRPALARLFVNPRQIGRLLAAAPRPTKPSDARLMAMLERYLAALDFAGAALSWTDRTITVHTVETLDPSKLDPWLRHWAGTNPRRQPPLDRVPSSALAVVSGQLDALALFDAISEVVPEEDRPRLANIEIVLSGLLLGQDLRTSVLPRLGPGLLAYLDSSAQTVDGNAGAGSAAPSSWPFPLVAVLDWEGDDPTPPPPADSPPKQLAAHEPLPVSVASALDSALKTVLALTAMDEKRNQGRSRIRTNLVAGTTVTTLEPPVPFAYAVDRVSRRLVVGNSPDAVARYLEQSSDAKAGERFRRLRATAFPGDEAFLCVDLAALDKFADSHRQSLVQVLAARKQRPAADVEGDLVQVLALARLFEAAFLTSRFEADASIVHRKMGVILRQQNGN